MTVQLGKMNSASKDARELAHKIAPHLKELAEKLVHDGVSPDERTASYTLLLAAVGFAVVKDGRHAAADYLESLRDAAVGDLIEPQMF